MPAAKHQPGHAAPHATRVIDWNAQAIPGDGIASVKSVHVHLASGGDLQKSTFRGAAGPGCTIEAWADDEDPDADKLAYVHATINQSTSSVWVHWLTKRKAQEKRRAQDGCSDCPCENRPRTVAQSILGLTAAIGDLLGMVVMELEAEDNGSGKLIQYYSDVGFNISTALKGENVTMKAPIRKIASLMPQAWLPRMVPTDFDALVWIQCAESWDRRVMQDSHMGRILHSPNIPWIWKWQVAWPQDATVRVRMQAASNDYCRLSCEVTLSDGDGVELAMAKGAVRLNSRKLRVIWLGRSGSRSVHPMVKGMTPTGTACSGSGGEVTMALAVLGCLVVWSRWVDTEIVEITATDNGSGKLLNTLRGIGFEHLPGQSAEEDEPIQLAASAEEVSWNCCPSEWLESLPTQGDLGVLARIWS